LGLPFFVNLQVLEAVDFQDSNLEIGCGSQRRIIECQAAVGLAITNVFVDPDGLTFPVVLNSRNWGKNQSSVLNRR
jgi:hypothetical protein